MINDKKIFSRYNHKTGMFWSGGSWHKKKGDKGISEAEHEAMRTGEAKKNLYSLLSDSDLRRKEREYNFVANEGGEGHNPYTNEIERRYEAGAKNRESEKNLKEEKFKKTWTKEETAIRRKTWNDWATKENIIFNAEGVNAINKKQAELGWGMADLQKAVKMHGG